MSFIDMAARRRRQAGAVNYTAAVQSFLSGTTGFAVDPSNLTTLWQDTGRTSQVTTSGQAIAAIDTLYGTASYPLVNTLAASNYPTWSGAGALVGDEVDDWTYVAAGGSRTFTANINAFYGAAIIRISSFSGGNGRGIFFASVGPSDDLRIGLFVTNTGRLGAQVRRLDADAATTVQSAAGLVSTGTTYTAAVEINYSTGAITLYLNNVSVATGTHGSTGSTSNTTSYRFSLHGGPFSYFAASRQGLTICAPKIPTAGERASIQSWLTEVAL